MEKTKKDFDWILNEIENIMIEDGPDRHTDGSDVITDFIRALLDGKEDEWVKEYESKCNLRQKQRDEYRKKYTK